MRTWTFSVAMLALAVAGAGIAEAATARHAKQMRSDAGTATAQNAMMAAPAAGSYASDESCWKETNKDWGFGYPGACGTPNPTRATRAQDQLQYPGGGQR